MNEQTTPFLLLSKARTISLKDVFTMGEEKAYDLFRKMRWSDTGGAAVCPKCGHNQSYELKKRRQFECKACRRHYSVTSQTIFAGRKLSYTDLLAAIVLVVNSAKGISALQLARDLNHQHKSMWILVHKIREAMAAENDDVTLSGEVEVDGAYFGGHVKPTNRVENRVDRRLAEHQSGKRRAVVVARERDGRTVASVHKHETDSIETVSKQIEPGATVHADEAGHWDVLEAKFNTRRINHSVAYSEDGVCTNQAESYFSRLRRMVHGSHHHVSPKYLAAYADHTCWLEDNRRLDNGAITKRLVGLAMAQPVSRRWKGYWQRSSTG